MKSTVAMLSVWIHFCIATYNGAANQVGLALAVHFALKNASRWFIYKLYRVAIAEMGFAPFLQISLYDVHALLISLGATLKVYVRYKSNHQPVQV